MRLEQLPREIRSKFIQEYREVLNYCNEDACTDTAVIQIIKDRQLDFSIYQDEADRFYLDYEEKIS